MFQPSSRSSPSVGKVVVAGRQTSGLDPGRDCHIEWQGDHCDPTMATMAPEMERSNEMSICFPLTEAGNQLGTMLGTICNHHLSDMHHINGSLLDMFLIPFRFLWPDALFHMFPFTQASVKMDLKGCALWTFTDSNYDILKKWFCMLSMCTSACIMQHHTTSCNMRSEVKTYEDPNSRIVLAPHEPIFLRTHDKTWQNNANLSNIFDKNTNSIRQEKCHREHVELVWNVQRQDISQLLQSPTSRPFMTFLPNWCGFFNGFLRVCTWRV